jgi:predicted AlkP superfamily phosphohydrolase/phosphomutase
MRASISRCIRPVVLAITVSIAGGASAQQVPRAIVVSWDGAADWVVDRLLTENKLPNLARMVRSGFAAESMTPANPSKTAVGHAAIWTGCWGDRNGVTGNGVPLRPRSDHTLLESQSGYDSRAMQAEPLYVTAARQNKKVVVLSATQSYPPDPWVAELAKEGVRADRLITFSGFESPVSNHRMLTAADFRPALDLGGAGSPRGAVRECVLQLGDSRFRIVLVGDQSGEVPGFDRARIEALGATATGTASEPSQVAEIRPRAGGAPMTFWSPPFLVKKGDLSANVAFRLFELSPDGSHVSLYVSKANALRGSATPAEASDYLSAYPHFHDDPFFDYQSGLYGPTLWQGGTGEAERRILEIVERDCDLLASGSTFAWNHWKPDLMFHYTPMSDSAGHTWMGALDPSSSRHDPKLAAKIWPLYEKVYQLQDRWLGKLLDLAGPENIVCLVSDHGMQGNHNTVYVNTILARAGLVAWDASGRLDLFKTKVCAPPYGEFFLVVNGTDRKGGIVEPGERDRVLSEAIRALQSAKDPVTGNALIKALYRNEAYAELGFGGEAGGDVLLDFADDYYPSASRSDNIAGVVASPIGSGVHGGFSKRPKLQAICYMAGGPIAKGKRGPAIRQIDVAPTLCALLGIRPPAQAVGSACAVK